MSYCPAVGYCSNQLRRLCYTTVLYYFTYDDDHDDVDDDVDYDEEDDYDVAMVIKFMMTKTFMMKIN